MTKHKQQITICCSQLLPSRLISSRPTWYQTTNALPDYRKKTRKKTNYATKYRQLVSLSESTKDLNTAKDTDITSVLQLPDYLWFYIYWSDTINPCIHVADLFLSKWTQLSELQLIKKHIKFSPHVAVRQKAYYKVHWSHTVVNLQYIIVFRLRQLV